MSEERPRGDGDRRFDSDPDRVETLRAIADEIRAESSESKQLAATLYRVSDLYDEDEETTPEEILRNVRTILEVKTAGGRDP
jgi:superfamily I DNA/RNA helicase